jgi:hypothetical protein
LHILHLLHQHRQINMDYLKFLLNTYISEKEIFAEVVQNRQIQFEKEQSISKKEFYFNCRKVIEFLKNKIDDRFYKRQDELCQIIDLREAKEEPTESIENELNTIHKNQFPINLLHLTADKFTGHFYLTDVNFIETSLKELQFMAKKKYNLLAFFEDLKNDLEFIKLNERFKSDAGIQTNLSIKLKDATIANVYSVGMWYILTNDEFASECFIDAYAKGFEDGKQFITEKTNKALKGFYASCTKEYIEELHYAYFFNAENYILGYKNGACHYPITFDIYGIEKIGFSAGVVSTIDLMVKENPILFDGFYDVDIDQPQQLVVVNPIEINENFKLKQNIFDDVDPNKVFQHFKSLVENGYITQQNLNDFLSTVFERGETLSIKIDIVKLNSKTRVKKIFYTYLETYVQNKYGSQKKYIDLLCNNFTGFNAKTLSTNFAK